MVILEDQAVQVRNALLALARPTLVTINDVDRLQRRCSCWKFGSIADGIMGDRERDHLCILGQGSKHNYFVIDLD